MKEYANQFTKAWYDEVEMYNFENSKWQPGTGHFTQIVWKQTTYLGCGIAKNKYEQGITIVCQYTPQGNYLRRFSMNVLPI